MKQRILPSVMAKNQKDMNFLFAKLEGIVTRLHLDVADGKFVPNTSLDFPLRLSSKFTYNAHLMLNNPSSWIDRYAKRVDSVIFHPESLNERKIYSLMEKVKGYGTKVGLALRPETAVDSIASHLPSLDYMLILTVHPGFYGAKYLKRPLSKIKQIKKINPFIEVIVDGGMNPDTIYGAYTAGADYFVSGSYVTKAADSKKAMKELNKLLR